MRTLGNAPLLLLLTSAIASCSDSSVLLRAEDDSGSEAGLSTDATADVAPPGHDAATRDDAGDGAVTAADTGALDTGGDAVVDAQAGDGGCPPGYNPSGPDGGCTPTTIRRPFLVGSSLRSAPSVARGDWVVEVPPTTQPLPALTAQKLARTWLKDGLEEHASVAAFARFTMHLLSVGAPPELLVEAQRASLDEIRHAKICFALARRYGMTVTGPGNLSLRDALPDASLAEIVALAAEEGCVGETLGAALAREQLAVAKDPHVAEALRKISRDEARHAELSWRFLRWAVLRGGDAIRRVASNHIEKAIEATLAMEIQSYDGIDLDEWHAHGRLTCAESRAVADLAIREVVRPCLQATLKAVVQRRTSDGVVGAAVRA